MIEHFLRSCLLFTHPLAIIILLIIGYIWLDKRLFVHLWFMLMISILFNMCLKITFKLPLAAFLHHDGFAFPSGHMQTALVLYGGIFSTSHSTALKSSIAVLLCGIASGLVYFHYHNLYDIGGAVLSGGLVLLSYRWLISQCSPSWLMLLICLLATVMMLYISIAYKLLRPAWQAYYALLGMVLADYAYKDQAQHAPSKLTKIKATIVCISSVFVFHQYIACPSLPAALIEAKWSIVSAAIPCSLYWL